jgi:hypothetical protein
VFVTIPKRMNRTLWFRIQAFLFESKQYGTGNR